MGEKFDQLSLKIDYLEKLFSLSQTNVNNNLALTWTILGVVIAIIGVALFFLAQMWVNKKVDIEMQMFKKDYLKEMENLIFSNPQILRFEVQVEPNDEGEIQIDIPFEYNIKNEENLKMFCDTWSLEMSIRYHDGDTLMEAKNTAKLVIIKFDKNINRIFCNIKSNVSFTRYDKHIAHIFLLNDNFKSVSMLENT